MRVSVPVWLVVLTIIAFVALVVILWSVKRRRRPHIRLAHIDDADSLMRSIAGFTQGRVVAGNSVTLVQNGSFFDSLLADIAAAKRSICLETFLSKEGEVTRKISAALVERARAGVEVRVMLDGSGGREFGDDALKAMTDAGCTVTFFHPLNFRNLGRINNRTHRKIVVVDGRIGYVGGHCLVDDWLGTAQDKKHFRDITARVEGPVVAELLSAFTDNWIEECGEVPAGDGLYPELVPTGKTDAHVVHLSPTGSPSTMKLLHYAAIHAAQKRLLIQNPYFLPDPDARDALAAAAGRGVEVRIMIPAAAITDSPIVQHASHHHYGTLMKGGVRIFEYQRTLLHQKILVVDGKWASIGSSNFDDRSFEINEEVSLVAYDETLAAELEAIFEADLKECKEQHLEPWKRRPWTHKMRDFTSFLFNEQL